MTEDEAKEKKCCGPRTQGLSDDIPCIASACMAWREITNEDLDGSAEGIAATARERGVNFVTASRLMRQEASRRPRVVIGGFCGLAGQP